MRRKEIARLYGESTTGQRHDLLIEVDAEGAVMVTVLGADGKKRHASSVILPGALTDAVNAYRHNNPDRSL
jgi:hypothetical protein